MTPLANNSMEGHLHFEVYSVSKIGSQSTEYKDLEEDPTLKELVVFV